MKITYEELMKEFERLKAEKNPFTEEQIKAIVDARDNLGLGFNDIAEVLSKQNEKTYERGYIRRQYLKAKGIKE